jgi:hypothetical protein
MFSFLNPYMLWIKIGAAVLLIGGAFGSGMAVETKFKNAVIAGMERDQAKAVVAAYADAAKHQADADKITHDRDVANAAGHQKIVTVTQHIIQKVPTYVTPETDNRFPLPCGFVRLHDAAASGVEAAAVPIPANLADGQQCPVTASYAASIIAGNYGLALGWRADLQAWEKWYAEQAAAWSK